MTSAARFDRLVATATFAGDAHALWRSARLAIVGAGALGGQFAREAVRSGAHIEVFDFDVGASHNRGTQDVEIGEPKAVTTAKLCNAIAPGSARARVTDIRHVGPGELERITMIVDCSDDSGLGLPLTEVSNGWGLPLIRLAVDGSGQLELGRVLISDGGRGGACQLCASSWKDVYASGPRTPCPGNEVERAPTHAGSALAMSVAGLGLLSAQRLIGGNGADRVRDRELIVDLDTPQILAMTHRRNEACLSGHHRWSPIRLGRTARGTTVAELMTLTEEALTSTRDGARSTDRPSDVSVSCPWHRIHLGVLCPNCSHEQVHPGTLWRPTPPCARCDGPMQRRRDMAFAELCRDQVEALGLADTSLEDLGLPARGALVFGHAHGHTPVHLLFD